MLSQPARSIILTLALILALLPAAVPARAQTSASEILFSIQTPAYTLDITPSGFDRLTIDGYDTTGQPGAASLPYHLYNLALPPDADPASLSVELLDVQTETLPGPYRLEAARAPQVKSRPLAPGASAVRQAGQPTAAGASLLSPGQLRRWSFARVRFDPVSYDPAAGTLSMITHAVLRLTYTPRAAALSPARLSDGVMDEEARALLDNFDQAQPWYPAGVTAAAAADYVIITTNAVVSNSARLADFVTFKQSQGYAVRLVTETDYNGLTGQSPNGRAEKIRQWLVNNYTALGIRYVLLIGNPDPEDPTASDSVGDLPMKMCYPVREANGVYDDSPTDYFYADLTGNWNLDGDNRYCEYDGDLAAGGVDLAAEVYVGRIPVYNSSATADLDRILQKTMSYESDPNPAWRRSALLPMSFADANTDDSYFAEQMRSQYLLSSGISTWTMYQQGTGACGADSPFSSDEALRGGSGVRDRWAGGDYGLVVWSGHGSTTSVAVGYDGCWDGDMIESASASSLDDSHPSFVYASSCNNGYPESASNLGYSLLRSGAVATIAASRVSWYVPGDYDFRSDPSVSGMGYEYNRRLVVNTDPAGKALYDTKNATATGDPAWLMNKFDMNLYGDPTARLLSDPPAGNPVPSLSALDPAQVAAGSPALTLTLTGSNFVSGAEVFWNGDALPTTFVSSTRLTAAVDPALLSAPASFGVTVSNPAPGGGASNRLTFQVIGPPGVCSPAAVLLADQPDTRGSNDPGSSRQIDTYPGIEWNETGPEFAYSFTPTQAGSYTARLTNLGADLDLFVLDGTPGSCAADNLVAYGDTTAAFTAAQDQPFYILVDGYNGAAGSYTLAVTCPGCPGQPVLTRLAPASIPASSPGFVLTVEGTHFTPDSVIQWDGAALATSFQTSTALTAAVDADLLLSPGSVPITVFTPGQPLSPPLPFEIAEDETGICKPRLELTGPARDTRRTDSFGSTDQVDTYSGSSWDESGPEFAYSYTPSSDRAVTVRLTGMKVDLDLMVIPGDAAGYCRAENALSVEDDTAQFDAQAGQTYYLVVDGYAGGAGAYTLTVDDDLPVPEDNLELLNNRPVFNWEDVDGATSYLLQVSPTVTFRSLVWNRSTRESLYFPTSDLPKARALYWRVIPRFGSARAEPLPTRLLWTAYPPSTPSLSSPASGSLQRTLTPLLRWRAAALSPTDAFGRYQVQVAADPTFLLPVIDTSIANRTPPELVLPAGLATNTRYYWRVRAFDADGQYGSWSAVRSFRTALAAPLLSQPGSGAAPGTLYPLFEWSSPDPASSYTLQLAFAGTFRSPLLTKTLKVNRFSPTAALKPGRLYYWRVRANGPNGPSAWSQSGWFYTP